MAVAPVAVPVAVPVVAAADVDEGPEETSAGFAAVALFDFDGEEEDEISFKAGDTITEIEKIDSGWWVGVFDGRKGMFPSNYVEDGN